MENIVKRDVSRDKIIDGYIKGREKNLSELTSWNRHFVFDVYNARKSLRYVINALYLFDMILESVTSSISVNMSYRTNGLKTNVRLLNKWYDRFDAINNRLGKRPVKDKKLIRAIKEDCLAAARTEEAFKEDIFPRYERICGLAGYSEYLGENNSSIGKDMASFMYGRVPENFSELQKQEKRDILEKLDLEYLSYVMHRMDELNIGFSDIRAAIMEENQNDLRTLEIRKKKEAEAIHVIKKKVASRDIDFISQKIRDVCASRVTYRKWKTCISRLQINRIEADVKKAGEDSFSLLVCSKPAERASTITYGMLNANGGITTTKDWSFKDATKFIGEDSNVLAGYAKTLQENNPGMMVKVEKFGVA